MQLLQDKVKKQRTKSFKDVDLINIYKVFTMSCSLRYLAYMKTDWQKSLFSEVFIFIKAQNLHPGYRIGKKLPRKVTFEGGLE